MYTTITTQGKHGIHLSFKKHGACQTQVDPGDMINTELTRF